MEVYTQQPIDWANCKAEEMRKWVFGFVPWAAEKAHVTYCHNEYNKLYLYAKQNTVAIVSEMEESPSPAQWELVSPEFIPRHLTVGGLEFWINDRLRLCQKSLFMGL